MARSITLALPADDRQKDSPADFALDHRPTLARFSLVATAGSGLVVRRRAQLAVRLFEPGAAGGAVIARAWGWAAAPPEIELGLLGLGELLTREAAPSGLAPSVNKPHSRC